MTYVPKVNDYVKWNKNGVIHEGWVYFVDNLYITIEVGVKPKPNCEYTREEKHKFIHTLLCCFPEQWKDLNLIKSRKSVYETD